MALKLRAKGIKQVRPLLGGFFGWRDRGFPLYLDPTLEVPKGRHKPLGQTAVASRPSSGKTSDVGRQTSAQV